MTSVSAIKMHNRNQCRLNFPSLKSLFVGCVIFAIVFAVFCMKELKLHNVIGESLKNVRRVNVRNKRVGYNNNILCVTYQGRLGNNMFQFAAAYAIAKKNNMTLIVLETNPLVNIFNISALPLSLVNLPEDHCSKIYPTTDRWYCSYDPSIMNVSNSSDIRLKGYFQSWKYWIDYEEEIRQLFTFRRNIMSKVEIQMATVRSKFAKGTVLIGVHARRRDYISDKKIGLTVATAEYFLHAFHYFRSKFREVAFLIFSDDFNWCKFNFRNESNLYFMEGGSPVVDMALLSIVNHTILSVGTFGFWGAWLANGTSIYYNNLFVPGSKHASNYRGNETSDYLYPGWIPML